MDRVTLANDEDEQLEVTDRKYWENRSTPKMLKNVDSIFAELQDVIGGYELKYNKFYIGMSKDGISKNFLTFRPKKNYMYLGFKGNEDSEMMQRVDNEGLEINYNARFKEYSIRINSIEDYKKHKQLIDSLIQGSKEYFNILDD